MPPPQIKSVIYLATLLVVLTLPSCRPTEALAPLGGWHYADLRGMDPVDASNPSHDLIAIYTRIHHTTLDIRLDFLDMPDSIDYDLYAAIDSLPGGTTYLPIGTPADLEWDILISLPARGVPQTLSPNLVARRNLIPTIVRNPDLDYLTLSLNANVLPQTKYGFRTQVFLTPADSKNLGDSIGPVHSDDSPPPRVPVILAFYNTFPAYSPAQALRRWDGAHTGPFGGRHGLRSLLRAVNQTQIPIILLDLKSPAVLSALDYLGGTDRINEMAARNTIILPDAIPLSVQSSQIQLPFRPPDWTLGLAAEQARQSGPNYGLPPSQMLYAPLLPTHIPSRYRVVFTLASENQSQTAAAWKSQPAQWDHRLMIQVPATSPEVQITPSGLSLELRHLLVQEAISRSSNGDPHDPSILVLGGDLATTAWGDFESAYQALNEIAHRPWIWPFTGADIQSAKGRKNIPRPLQLTSQPFIPHTSMGDPIPSGWTTTQIQDHLLDQLLQVPSGPISEQAWSAYWALFSPNPPEDPDLPFLRANFLGEIGHLIAAAHWEAEPISVIDCTGDLDYDGLPECILASDHIFTVIDPLGAHLSLALSRTDRGPIQWIAPSSQFVVGFSDPSTWDIHWGPSGDPGVIPGAFGDLDIPWKRYTFDIQGEKLVFSTEDGSLNKSFHLGPGKIHVDYEQAEERTIRVQIPVAIAPTSRFNAGWGLDYQASPTETGWLFEHGAGFQVRVQSSEPMAVDNFLDSRDLLVFPEDPNRNFPPGHFLPFPLALVELIGEGDFTVELSAAISSP